MTVVDDLILLRGGTAAEWVARNPVLAAREPGLETDTQRVKYGNGVTRWAQLPYGAVSSHSHKATDVSDSSTVGRAVITAASQAAARSAITALEGKSSGGKGTVTGDLWVEREAASGVVEADLSNVGYGVGPVIHGRRANGTKAAPTAAPAGLLWGIGARPYTGTDWTAHSPAAIHWLAETAISDSNHGAFMRFWATAQGKTQADRVAVLDLKASPAGGGRLESDFSSATQLARTLFRTSVPNSGTSVGCVPNIDTAHAQWNAWGLADPTNSPYGALKATATDVEVISGATGTGTVRPLHLTVGATRAVTIGTDGIVDKFTVPTAMAVKTAAQSLATSGQFIALTWQSESWDTDGLHDTASNTSRMTAPVAGKYRVTASVIFASNPTGVRLLVFRVNGAVDDRFGYQGTNALGSSLATPLTSSAELNLNAGDYVEVFAYQSSGAALDVEAEGVQRGRCRFGMTYISA